MGLSASRFIAGLPNGAALAWELAQQLRGNGLARPVALVPDLAWALNLRDDLSVFAPELKVYVLPPFETDLLKNRGPSVLRRVERLRFFCALHAVQATSSALFLVTASALHQRSPRAEFWKNQTLHIKTGQELSRSDLSDQLARLGYLAAELVERPTEFAVRGSIVDVFSPLLDYPVRIELFGDEIQSIRLFHPESQRRIEDLTEAILPPCREFLFPDDNDAPAADELRARVRQAVDDLDWDKRDRDALLGRFQQRSFFPSIDYWGPLISPDLYTRLIDALGGAAPSLAVEAHALDPEFRTSRREMERHFLAARTDGEWVPSADSFLYEVSESAALLETSLKAEPRLWIGLRAQTGLAFEPSDRNDASIKSLELLSQRLAADRLQSAELPLEHLADQIRQWNSLGTKAVFVGSTLAQSERLAFLLGHYGITLHAQDSFAEALATQAPLTSTVGSLSEGFSDERRRVVVLLDEHVFGTKKKRVSSAARTTQKNAASVFTGDLALLDLKPGDLVVHNEHGIGRYLGLKAMQLDGVNSELLEIEYREGSKLFVPVTRLNAIQKYSGADAEAPLDRLGGQTWETKRAKARRELQSIAGELLHLYSMREMARGPEIKPSEMQIEEFAATFPFTETPDQAAAIADCLRDLRGPKPMDRLVCGDVGYGKTEIALRAAHAAVAAGYQVAVLVPTTILAAQHENTFVKRLTPLGFRVAGISRFKSTKQAKELLAKASRGELDVLIGTHRLLSQDVTFKKLGLLVIDEEQRFGVVHKEKIKKMRANVHALSMTATPIPRTLNMAMSGLKDLSVITTAPQDRLSVRTHVARKKSALITEAIEHELKRGGQVFYVHNRIQTMPKEMDFLRQAAPPDTRIEFAHGQLEEHQLEERMMNFYEGRTQVLLTTAIVESGLDVPNANTLIIDRADHFGLAQLYQLRGRVGRSNQRAYAYFLLPERGDITQDAEDRLAVLESYQELGSGFHIASHDLELRGSGDLLGRSQHGHMSALGFDAYVELLQECVAEIKGEPLEHKVDPEISLGIDTTIPEAYVPEIGLRLSFYRKLAAASDESEIDHIEHEMDDRFGTPPESVKNLFSVMRIKCQLRRLGVKALKAGKSGYSVAFDPSTPVVPARMVKAVSRYPAHFQMNPDGRLLIKRRTETADPRKIMQGIEAALSEVEAWCE